MIQRQRSTTDTLSLRLRQELVTALMQSGAIHSPAIQQAFLTVPREAFVPFFYREDETSRKMAWVRVEATQCSPEEYLAQIYRNDPLVTKVDDRGWPVSSSSMPSAMGKMLEALDVRPGQRVLEIGAGSGYNAALLACLSDDAHNIVTIEHDATLAVHAKEALGKVLGEGAAVIVGDGFLGYDQGGLYDRIIATASVGTLPRAWIAQLQVEGKLVMDLQGSLASGFLVVEKSTERVIGHFLAEPLHFMPLETEAVVAPKANIAMLVQQPCSATFVLEKDHIFPGKLFDPAFRWFLQWRLLGCQVSKQRQRTRETGTMLHSVFLVEPQSKAVVRLQQQEGEELWHGTAYGPPSFWDDLQQAWHDFLSIGAPSQQEYQVVVEEESSFLLIGPFRFPF